MATLTNNTGLLGNNKSLAKNQKPLPNIIPGSANGTGPSDKVTGGYSNTVYKGTSFYRPNQSADVSDAIGVGAKATSPQDNVQQPKNTLADSQVAPPAKPTTSSTQTATSNTGVSSPGSTGLVGSPTALSNSQYVGQVGAFNPNTDPGVSAALKRQQEFENQYATDQTNIASGANPFGAESSLSDLSAARHSLLSPVYQAQVGQAYTGAGQRLGALESAAGSTAPIQVSPGNAIVSPISGTDVATGKAPDPFSGGVRQGQVALGNQYATNLPVLNTAKTLTPGLITQISQSGLNSNDLNAANWLNQVIGSNTSNPLYPQMQSQFNNIITQYARVLGVDPNTLITNLSATAKGTTIQNLLQNLDRQATTANESLRNPTYTPPSAQPASQPITTPSGGTVHEGDTHVFSGVTYRAVNGNWVAQ